MRVLFVSRGFPPHGRWGTEAYTLQLARGLHQSGHEVCVFHPEQREDLAPYQLSSVREGPFQVTRVNLPRVRGKRLVHSYEDPRLEAAFEQFLLRERPDVVHFTYLLWTLSVRMPRIVRRLGIGCVLTATDFGLACHRGQFFDWRLKDCGGPHTPAVCARCIREPSRLEGTPLQVRAKRWLAHSLASLGGVGRVVVRADLERRERAVSESLACVDEAIAPTAGVARMLAHAGLELSRITQQCYAVDPTPFERACARPKSRVVHIGFLGQFAAHKGPHVLLDAVAILERRLPEAVEPWDVIFYGEGVPGRHRRYPEELRARATSPRVFLAPPYDPSAVGEVLSSLSCVVVPSLWQENAPLSALEARAAGIPVIASSVPGLAEIIEPGVHGALFPPGDAQALADLLRDVILGRIAPRHAPSQPVEFPVHLALIDSLQRRAAERAKLAGAGLS
jgi:glycosyltransferase involved in cell wall biosynthesis